MSWRVSGEEAFDAWPETDPEKRLAVIEWCHKTFPNGPPKDAIDVARVPLRLGVWNGRVPTAPDVLVTWLEMPNATPMAIAIMEIRTIPR